MTILYHLRFTVATSLVTSTFAYRICNQLDWVDGGLEAITAVSASDAGRVESYLRLTRQGRWGRIIKAEVLNALGNPAVMRRTLNAEKIPIYVEGIGGAQPYGEKLPETSSLDFVLNGNDVAEGTSRDQNGQVNWRVIYDRVGSTGSIARARFANHRDFEASSTQRASHMATAMPKRKSQILSKLEKIREKCEN